MKFDIRNRFSGAVQFTAEIDCADDAPTSIKIGLAVKWAIKARANLTGAYLAGANLAGADLTGANLTGADLARANLTGAYLALADLTRADLAGADLARADLTGADLAGADLAGANLTGADLADQWIIQGPARSDGYAFFLQKLKDDKEPMIKAGCRYFTIAEAQAHWERTRAGEKLLDETKVIIRGMIDLARIRGLME